MCGVGFRKKGKMCGVGFVKKGKMYGVRFGKEDEGRKRGGGDCRVRFVKDEGRRRKWWRRSICRLGLGKKKKV